ncbi:Structural maintenance of chromosomes protein 3 [Elasticomyces elasticus]|nr:Structural maintenance of chromosomes protein 3 [Elasticomyces elasticus]
MYIKQIVIQGFKSYKDQTIIEPFSPKLNVIVGRNGSGKSNFFAAIRFVLSDAYTQMGREERQALLHEGSGSVVMSGYVEIIFDNKDERFPTGKDELILRRTIGQKKDEYSLDRKNATKSDVMNLLESAGFSRSNPYYIVPQGRVTALTNMKDAERLSLLKEVAGTHVYEARRTESLRIMEDTQNKRDKIDDLLQYIGDRLNELEEEKEELREYQEKDRERKCLEYTIQHREQEAITAALEQLDERRQNGLDETDDNRERFVEGERVMAEIDAEIADLKQKIEFLNIDKRQLEDERRETARDKASIELDVRKLSDGQSTAQQARTRHEDDLRQVQEQIQQREAELAEIIPQYNSQLEQEAAMKARLAQAEGTRQRLYAKQGRQAQFQNKRARDNWLRKEIDEVNIALATRKAVTMQTTEDIAELEIEIGRLDTEVGNIRSRIENRGDQMQTLSAEIQRAKEERDRLIDQRKELWREEAKLDSVITHAKTELFKAEKFLSRMMDQNTTNGLAAVRRIKKQLNLEGVYGTLAELFEVSDKYKTAVEVTAGTSLFHIVVDSDETATRVLEILQRDKQGRVTFMPLNRLRPKPANVPKASDAVHLVTKIRFNQQYDQAFQQVFGKTVVCPSLQIAAQYARSYGISAITPEGDRSDKKGALTGGFHDPQMSRIDGVRNVTKWREEYERHVARQDEIKVSLQRLDQQITRAVGELQKVEQRRQQDENNYGPLRQELRSKTVDLQNKRDALAVKQRSRDNVEAAVRELGEQQSAYETELASDFRRALTADEERQLETLSSTVQDLRRQYSELSSARSELEERKTTIEVELRENLRLRLDQLQSQDFDNTSGSNSNQSRERQRELQRINQAVDAISAKLQESDTAIEQAHSQLAEAEANKAEKVKQQEELALVISRHQKSVEKALSKRARLSDAATNVQAQIRALGVLPDAAFTAQYTNMDSRRAESRLHKVKDSLKKYGHVNKKAFEQYNSFTRQQETLTKRREELTTSKGSIQELIDVLDQRKDEAIERTFRQVSREFARIFERLVPAGKGRLVIQRRTDRQARGEDDEDSDEDGHRDGVENYTGVGISVSFNSKHDDQQRIQQLSGGQKSLCALALVFAIQASDPAPFYLFDEIDANLDAQYRTAVANMLHTISSNDENPAQFICTTFRSEMVHVAEKCYGVSYASNKTSSIGVIDEEDALRFIAEG